MKGVAVSIHDKFQDLGALVDILRHNWDDEYYISVCATTAEQAEELRGQDIDVDAVTHSEISFDPAMDERRGSIAKGARILDTFKKANKHILTQKPDIEYVLQLHADAWPLSEDRFEDLLDEMEQRDCSVAVRGKGWGFRAEGMNLGHISDQFLVYDTERIREAGFYDVNPVDLLPDEGIHTALPVMLLGRIGLSDIYLYSYMEADQNCLGQSTNLSFHSVRPTAFHPHYRLLHVGREDFPGTLGEAYQAAHLRREGITEGEYVKSLLEEHPRDLEDLRSELRAIYEDQNRQLRLLGFDPERYTTDFRKKENILDAGIGQKGIYLVRNIVKRSYLAAHRALFKIMPAENQYFSADPATMFLTTDSSWPDESLKERYARHTQREDFPEEYQDFWFED